MNFLQRFQKRMQVSFDAKKADEFTVAAGIYADKLFSAWGLIDELHLIIQDITHVAVMKKDGHLDQHRALLSLSGLQRQAGQIASTIAKEIQTIEEPDKLFFDGRQISFWCNAINELESLSDIATKLFLVADTFGESAIPKNSAEYEYWLVEYVLLTRSFLDGKVQANVSAVAKMKDGLPSKDFRKCLMAFSKVDLALFDIITNWVGSTEEQRFDHSHEIIVFEAKNTREYIKAGLENIGKCRTRFSERKEPGAQKIILTLPQYENSFELEEVIVKCYLNILENVSAIQFRGALLESLVALTKKRSTFMRARLNIMKAALV